MATEFSDPAWWPKPPPKPPKPIPLTKILVGTIVPLAVIAGVVVLVLTQRPKAAPTRSIAAFETCLRTQGIVAGDQSPQAERAAHACRGKLPAGTTFQPEQQEGGSAADAQKRFNECVQSALASIPRRSGPFGRGGGRSGVGDAVAVCRTLVPAAGEPGAPVTTIPSTA
jgi:hypothetical protein